MKGTDKIDFGIHNGTQFNQVPASYLFWAYYNIKGRICNGVKSYVDANWNLLLDRLTYQEMSDLYFNKNWTRPKKGSNRHDLYMALSKPV